MVSSEGSLNTEIEETAAQTEKLTQAKDRGQVTATGAMSIVNIALLREVIDGGEATNRYYTASMVLISVSLALQMVAGLLSLFVSNLKSYYTANSGTVLEDLGSNICCCKIIKKDHKEKQFGKDYDTKQKTDVEDPGWCPCACDMTGLKEEELDILEMYDHWSRQQTELDLSNEKASAELEHLKRTTQAAKDQLAALDEHKHTFSEEECKVKAAEIQTKIAEAQKQQETFEELMLSKNISDRQGAVLKKRADLIRKRQTNKMASFWQHIINYIFYTVFVMNMFITGLTIANNTVIRTVGNGTAAASK